MNKRIIISWSYNSMVNKIRESEGIKKDLYSSSLIYHRSREPRRKRLYYAHKKSGYIPHRMHFIMTLLIFFFLSRISPEIDWRLFRCCFFLFFCSFHLHLRSRLNHKKKYETSMYNKKIREHNNKTKNERWWKH